MATFPIPDFSVRNVIWVLQKWFEICSGIALGSSGTILAKSFQTLKFIIHYIYTKPGAYQLSLVRHSGWPSQCLEINLKMLTH